ncbi:transglycosylase SLT domain-containing protein [Streptomyces sp. NPDC004059]
MAAGGVLVGRGYVSIRPEFEGDWSRSVNTRASSAGRSGASAFAKAFGVGLKGIGALAGVAIGANLSTIAASAAAIAPALATAGAAAGALKLGLSGVGDAFKAAFADHTAEANAAASATKAVESAQRGLANAQRALADARVQAARGVADAEKQAESAERDLSDAQRNARDVQAQLNGAREEATRALEDMNTRLKESQLNERDAAIRLTDAQKELAAARANPGTTPEELAKLQLAYDRAKLNLQEQQTETKRLQEDTSKANKAGVEGSQQVLQVKDQIAQANRDVADKERALADAQAGVAQARADGQKQIEDAQRGVAEAAQALTEAQQAAASQTTKLDQAMAKLAPNARSFVGAVRALAPAWDHMRLSVQNALFKGLDGTVKTLAGATLPTLQKRLTETGGIWNQIAKSAAGAITDMGKSGMLDKILKGANDNLKVFANTPKQLITAFGQLSVAAQPAFNGLLKQVSGFITHFTDGISKAFASGGLQDAINTAFTLIGQLGTALGNALGIIGSIGKAASDAGGQILGVLGSVLAELNALFKSPQMQASLRSLFASVSQIIGAIVPVIGSVVQAVVPLLAAIAQPIAQLATVLGPVLAQLATTLGAALMPIIQALGPVLVTVGTAIVDIVQSVMPLLQPIATLITAVVTALAPALTPIIDVVTRLVDVLVGPLTQIVQALTPSLVMVGDLISTVFQALEPFLTPLVDLIGQVAGLIASLLAPALSAVMGALEPLIPVGIQLITTVLDALTPILPTLGDAFSAIATAMLSVLSAGGQVWASLAQQLAPVLADIVPVIGQLATLFATSLAQVLPTLATAFLTLLDALLPVLPLFAQIAGMVLEMASGVLIQLLPSILQLVEAGVQLALALLPIVPPLAQLVGLVLDLAINVLSWLLPPLISLADFLVGAFASALSTVIGWVAGLVTGIADLVTWITTNLGPAFKWLNEKVVQPAWSAIKTGIKGAWDYVIKPTFGFLKDGIHGVGDVFKWLRDKAVKPAWDGIKGTISTVWKYGIRPAFDALKGAIGKVATAFSDAKTAIGKAWDKIKDLTKKPINFVINSVWNKGIVGIWKKITGWIPGLPKLDTLPLLAQGGTIPAQPGVFNKPTAIVGEGRSAFPEFVIPTDPRYRARALSLWQAAGGQLMADGGILGDIWGGIKHIGGKVGGFFSSAAKFLADPGKALSALMGKLTKPLDDIKNSAWGKLAIAIPKSILHGLKDLVSFGGGGGGNIGGSIPKGKRLAIISQALAAAGVPPPGTLAQWEAGLNTLITRESGWNPNAINRWDSNAKAGHPSQGLAQTIPGTFNHYVPKSLKSRGILDPVANVAAAIRYIVSRYGNITNVQQANANKPPAGYDSGGWLQPGYTLAYNGTGRPEPVLTGAQWRTMTAAAGSGGPASFQGDLYLDSGEFLGRVRGEAQQVMQAGQQQLMAVINAS